MQIVGHRGCRDHYPENTVEAVRGSAPHVDLVEVDVQRCQSGEIVAFHDDRLGQLTDGRGLVRDHTYEELSRLSVGGSDATIPTLSAVLDALPEGTGINVELKHTGMGEDVARLVRNLDREVIVSSFEPDAIAPFRDEPVSTAHLFVGFFEENLATAAELGCEYVHPFHEVIDSNAIEQAHDRGLAVNAWTVPSSAKVTKLREAGVDGVIVDSWEIVPRWFDSPTELQETILKSL
jgi:glycerophosphoryl diester phosphodiesterase